MQRSYLKAVHSLFYLSHLLHRLPHTLHLEFGFTLVTFGQFSQMD